MRRLLVEDGLQLSESRSLRNQVATENGNPLVPVGISVSFQPVEISGPIDVYFLCGPGSGGCEHLAPMTQPRLRGILTESFPRQRTRLVNPALFEECLNPRYVRLGRMVSRDFGWLAHVRSSLPVPWR
jgi:hypothetical protein